MRRGIQLVATLAVIGAAAGALSGALAPTSYEGGAVVEVRAPQGAGTPDAPTINMVTERELALTDRVLTPVASLLGEELGSKELTDRVGGEVIAQTELLELSVRDEDPDTAERAASVYAESYLEQRAERLVNPLEQAEAALEEETEALVTEVAEAARRYGRTSARYELEVLNLSVAERNLAQVRRELASSDVGAVIDEIAADDDVGKNPLAAALIGAIGGLLIGLIALAALRLLGKDEG